ncbi:hypothetical protein DFJ73DRAFT_778465 [Zopfochytrium polystomum]|nr:hypothetical protein DFJ73DRAFT_778465 [Zopfochytrium polystomum]
MVDEHIKADAVRNNELHPSRASLTKTFIPLFIFSVSPPAYHTVSGSTSQKSNRPQHAIVCTRHSRGPPLNEGHLNGDSRFNTTPPDSLSTCSKRPGSNSTPRAAGVPSPPQHYLWGHVPLFAKSRHRRYDMLLDPFKVLGPNWSANVPNGYGITAMLHTVDPAVVQHILRDSFEKYRNGGGPNLKQAAESSKVLDFDASFRAMVTDSAAGGSERRSGGETGRGAGKNLLDLFMEDRDEAGNGLSDKDLRDAMINLLLADRLKLPTILDTTATALSWAIFDLAQRPDVVQKIRHEVEPVVHERLPTYDSVKELTYVTAVLHPSVPSDARYADQHDVLPGGISVAPNTMIGWSTPRKPMTTPDPAAIASAAAHHADADAAAVRARLNARLESAVALLIAQDSQGFFSPPPDVAAATAAPAVATRSSARRTATAASTAAVATTTLAAPAGLTSSNLSALLEAARSNQFEDLAHFQREVQAVFLHVKILHTGDEAVKLEAAKLHKFTLALVDAIASEGFPTTAAHRPSTAGTNGLADATGYVSPSDEFDRVALARKGDDGLFYFTSSSSANLVDSQIPASSDFMKVRVGATPSLEPNHVRALGDFDSAAEASRLARRRETENVTPLPTSLPYTPFSAFAPTSDSSDSGVPHVELPALLAATNDPAAASILSLFHPPADVAPGAAPLLRFPSQKDLAAATRLLREAEAIDVDAVFRNYFAPDGADDDGDDADGDDEEEDGDEGDADGDGDVFMSGEDGTGSDGGGDGGGVGGTAGELMLLRESAVLLELLAVVQEARVARDLGSGVGVGASGGVGGEEVGIATRVADNLAELLSHAPTAAAIPRLPLQGAMQSLVAVDPAYRGALPAKQAFCVQA